MKKITFIFCLVASVVFAQQNEDYRVSSFSLKIEKASPQAIKEINGISDISKRRVELDESITQEDFNKICNEMPWVKDLQIAYGSKEISNIEAISKLTNLEQLEIRNLASSKSQPLNLKPLSSLKNLRYLNLEATKISGIDFLKPLIKVEILDLSSCAISSLDFLKNYKSLKTLSLRGYQHSFKNYTALLGLSALEEIDLYSNKQATQENLQVLNRLQSLKKISLKGNRNISSLDFVSNLKNLIVLDVDLCKSLSDISGLIACHSLEELKLSKSKVTDISVLKNLKKLFILDISNTEITDFSALLGLDLMEVNLSNTSFSDLEIFKEASDLKIMFLDDTQVTSLEPFKNNPRLSWLSIKNTMIKDLTPVLAAKQLGNITVSDDFPKSQLDLAESTLPKLLVYVAK